MADILACDICVIGAGSGGLTVAAGASQMGARTVLIERAHMGGDCLNFGCVPSKALLAAAKAAALPRRSARLGVALEGKADFAKVNDHVKQVIAAIAPMDSVERFEGLGVTVILGSARFVASDVVEAGGRRIRARRFVIATGSAPAAPPIAGLDRTPYLTNETIFDNRTRPDHLLIIGGGPIGLEMAQAHRRLGSQVTVLEAAKALGKDDAECAALVLQRLSREGVAIREGAKIERAEQADGAIRLTLAGGEVLRGSHLLVATGRKANVEDLQLEIAGVDYNAQGVKVDARLRTSNRRVYAVGDVAGGLQFTHVAGYHAGIVLRNALFRLPAKANAVIPWVTYTDPELAHVGLRETEARQQGEIRILRWPYHENDRAQTERETDGMAKIVTARNGRILGASIVGAHAGELIQPWVLALSRKLKIGAMASLVMPYPTFGEISKRAAGSFYAPKLFSDRTRKLVRFLARFG